MQGWRVGDEQLPLQQSGQHDPNAAPGPIWRTVSDSTNRVVIFDSAMTPATFWVRLDELDLKPGSPVKKLQRTHRAINPSGSARP